MIRRGGKLRIAWWAAVVVAAASALGMVASLYWINIGMSSPAGVACGLLGGNALLVYYDPSIYPSGAGVFGMSLQTWDEITGGQVDLMTRFRYLFKSLPLTYAQSGYGVSVPLWMPLVIGSAVAVILGRKLKRPPPYACACGYDLTGNVSGRCPECGATVAVAADRAGE